MKQTALSALLLVLLLSSFSCKNKSSNQESPQNLKSSELIVYYFHFTRRCATCMAIEENARKAVEALYPDKVKLNEYSFSSINLDEPGSKEIADKLGIGGQTLLVVHGDKKIDITDKGFLNAHDPDKMKEEIKSAVDKVQL
jgi:hypothetical protein